MEWLEHFRFTRLPFVIPVQPFVIPAKAGILYGPGERQDSCFRRNDKERSGNALVGVMANLVMSPLYESE
jgi:hypothetical protein